MLGGLAILAAITGIASLVMAFARTGPDEAGSNLSKWLGKAGFHKIPSWVKARAADRWMGRAGLLMIGVFLFIAGMLVANWQSRLGSLWPSRGPIDWQSGSPNLTFITSKRDNALWVDGFQIVARNRSDRPLRGCYAAFTPDMTGIREQFSFSVEGHDVAMGGTDVIPPRTSFTLSYRFPTSMKPGDLPHGLGAISFLGFCTVGTSDTFFFPDILFSLADMEARVKSLQR